MLKQHMAAYLIAVTFVAGPAVAQTSTAPANPPPTPAPTAQSPASAMPGGASGQFVTEQPLTQWRASKLVGVDVYGTDDAKIGDIREVLLNRDGNAETVVIGVGGFLGIGEKDVAVPFKTLEWVIEPRATVTSPVTGPTGTALPGAVAPGTTATGPTTGTTARTGSAVVAASRGYPDHVVLRMTKADLQNAPTFRYASDTRATTTAPAGNLNPLVTTNPPATAPRQ